VEDYLDLYINFRLKVKEANELGLAQSDRLQDEFAIYESQLINSYLDKEVLEKILTQEYERSKTDVSLSHIFMPFYNDSTEKIAKTKINKIYSNIINNKISFEDAAAESEDENTKNNKGYLGWYNSYQITLPEIEDAAYQLKTKEISKPIKTKYGYHILKLNDTRPARPKLKVAIIKKNLPYSNDSLPVKALRDTIYKICSRYKNGVSFDDLVQQYSEDESTKPFGGKLDWFGINTYVPAFEEAAYAIKNIGDISEPVQTQTAFYIIQKLDETKPQSFEEEKVELRNKLINSDIYEQEMQAFLNHKKATYNFILYNKNIDAFKKYLQTFVGNFAFKYRDTFPNNILYKIDNEDFDQNKIGKSIEKIYYTFNHKNNSISRIDALYNEVEKQNILNRYRNDIKNNNLEYRQLIEEYKNGIMIFDLSEQKIWNKATEDTAALRDFYNKNQSLFKQKASVAERTITTDQPQTAKKIYAELAKNPNLSTSVLKDKLSALGDKAATVEDKTVELPDNKAIATLSKPIKYAGKSLIRQQYHFVPESAKPYEDVRGYVIAAYQEKLEHDWIEELKAKYPVSVNEAVLQKIIK
jgi:peptidyl-prolyl cis-trans isomerase SurA